MKYSQLHRGLSVDEAAGYAGSKELSRQFQRVNWLEPFVEIRRLTKMQHPDQNHASRKRSQAESNSNLHLAIGNTVYEHGLVRVFEDQPDILKDGMALRFNIVTDDIAGTIERHARNFFSAAHARPDPRQKQQIAHAFCMRKRAHRFRRAFAFEGCA